MAPSLLTILCSFNIFATVVLAGCSSIEYERTLGIVNSDNQRIFVDKGKHCPADAAVAGDDCLDPDYATDGCYLAWTGQATARGYINVTSDAGIELNQEEEDSLFTAWISEYAAQISDPNLLLFQKLTTCFNYFPATQGPRCLNAGQYGTLAWTPTIRCFIATVRDCDEGGNLEDGMSVTICGPRARPHVAVLPSGDYERLAEGSVEVVQLSASTYRSVESQTDFNQVCNNAEVSSAAVKSVVSQITVLVVAVGAMFGVMWL